MGKNLDLDLSALDQLLLKQADQVESMLVSACRGLRDATDQSVADVRAQEVIINHSEVFIEEHCLKLLALQQPVAIDLRRVTAILKINNDLERIADLVVNIANRAEALRGYPHLSIPDSIDQMLQAVLAMLRDAHAAFVDIDANLANEVCKRDDVIDDLCKGVIDELINAMRAEPEDVPGYLHIFSVSRIIERIGDHATNIAEDVIYLAQGEITRHGLHLVEQ